ncbi:MAG: hypothetical protein QOF66_6789 [Mycobacterium sp.]|jgi:NAD(P)-dependent dehydrogenase (short-subunit alcohol dehydrogenase family)|uniref:hypothetical protein n=1 Tax=Mycobacterium sp. TaxID=1785 RepID=UPI0028B77650|nr:hypothetical protein [Mycobacterium sp.]
MRLDDKVTLITGMSQYMGRAFTRTFADASTIVVQAPTLKPRPEPDRKMTRR